MKKSILGSLLVSVLVLGAYGTVALADDSNLDEPAVAETKGDVIFEKGEKPVTPVDPTDPKEPVDPTDPIDPVETNGVWLMHAPTFHFGSIKVNPLGDTYPVESTQFNPDDADKTFYAPNFLQIHDVSGKDTLVWGVTVQQKAAFKEENGHELENTRIRLLGQTIFNSNGTENADKLTGFTLDKTDNEVEYGEIPVDTVMPVFSSKTAGTTNNTISTLTFKDNYTAADKTAEKGHNNDVLLSVPRGETPKAETAYSTDFVWTLTATP